MKPWIVLLLVLLGPLAYGESIKLVTGNNYPPFTDRELMNGGLATDIVRQALLSSGHEVDIQFMPWARGYNSAQDHTFVGTFPYAKNPERAKEFLYSDPIVTLNQVFFIRKGSNVKFDQDEDLDGTTVCKPLGYNTDDVQKFMDEGWIKLSRPTDLPNCFKMLKIGRVHLVLAGDLIGKHLVNIEQGVSMEDFEILPRPLGDLPLHLIVAKSLPNGAAMIEQFNLGLEKLQASGEMEKIIGAHLDN